MRKKVFESISIIGGAILTSTPYFASEADMSVGSWICAGIGFAAILFGVCWSILKREKYIGYKDQQAIIEKRKVIFPELKKSINHRLAIDKSLANYATELSLYDYRDQYLKPSIQYKFFHIWYRVNEEQTILSTMCHTKFFFDNLHYRFLKEHDFELEKIMPNYRLLSSEVNDKKLNKLLKVLWNLEHKLYSIYIVSELIKNNPKILNTPNSIRTDNSGIKIVEDTINKQFQSIINRMNELIDGDDFVIVPNR